MERGRPTPLETDLEFAPNTYEALVEEVGSLACTSRESCFQRGGEFQDRHHLIFSQEGDLSEAEQLLKCHPDFIIGVCRCIHQNAHRTWDRSEPLSDEFVVGYLMASPLNLNANKRRKLLELRKAL